MTLPIKLVHCAHMEDWFVLEGGTNWASVEGGSQEWREVAAELRSGGGVSFRRLAFEQYGGKLRFWSPRNSRGDVDVVTAPAGEAGELAAHIDRVLACYAAERDDEKLVP